jgi:hypothetical protein
MMDRNYSSANHRARKKTWMLRASAFAFVCAGLTLPAFAQNAPATQEKQQSAEAQTTGIPAWGLTSSDLPADPSVRFGVLPNGMRYALKRNVTPKGAAVIRFAFDVGMREAEPEQGGAAHFLEHMAFNGSTNIPEGELVKRLERLGLAFGRRERRQLRRSGGSKARAGRTQSLGPHAHARFRIGLRLRGCGRPTVGRRHLGRVGVGPSARATAFVGLDKETVAVRVRP